MYITGKLPIIAILSLLCTAITTAANTSNVLPDYKGKTTYRIDTLLSLPDTLFKGPFDNFEFTVDNYGNIFLYEAEARTLKKLSGNRIVCTKAIRDTVITLAYYGGKVWQFDGRKVLGYDTSSLCPSEPTYL